MILKKRTFFKHAFFGVAFFLCSVQADEVSTVKKLQLETNGSHRAFIEANVGMNIGRLPLRDAPDIESFSGFIWNTEFGYQFNPYIAFEIGFSQYKRSDTQQSADIANAVIIGIWPPGHHLKIFAKGGMSYLFPENVNGKKIVPYFGLGLAVIVNTYMDLTIQVTGVSTNGDAQLGAALLGMTLFFGEEESLYPDYGDDYDYSNKPPTAKPHVPS